MKRSIELPPSDVNTVFDPNQHLTSAQDVHFAQRASSWSDRYESSPSFRARLQLVGRAIDNILRDRPQPRVLDFGGGTGVFSVLASRWSANAVCVDRSLPMLAKGADKQRAIEDVVRRAGFDGPFGHVSRVVGDGRCAGSLRMEFDLIVAIAVLEYVTDVAFELDELARLMRDDGTILITVPNRMSPVRIGQLMIRPLLNVNRATRGRLADQSFVGIRPSGDRVPWRAAADAAGLVVNRIEELPLGLSGVRRWFHPTLMVSLCRPKGSNA